MIGKIARVPLREVWKHEALDFTRWLEQNLDLITDATGLSLSNVEREQSVGNFSADLVAEDSEGRLVVIENQLEKSDHDHLGKILTYVASLDAKTAIWIVAEPRPEHVQAVAWLNESNLAQFFLLKIEAIKIDESLPAPLLTQITAPSLEALDAGKTKKELADRQILREKFWRQLLDKAKEKTPLHAGISAGTHSWIGTGAGTSGVTWNYVIRQHSAASELYIDKDKDTGAGNTEIFDKIYQMRAEIESKFDAPFEWHRLDGKRACRIRKEINLGGWRDEEKWPEIHDEMIDSMIRLEKAIAPHLLQA